MIDTTQSYSHGTSEVALIGQTIGDNLAATAARLPDHDALVVPFQDVRLTYAALDTAVDELARALMAAGIEQGDRVGIWSPNNAEWVLVQYATARMGAILVNLNPAYRTHEVAYALEQSGCRLLISITSAGRLAELRPPPYFILIERALRDEGTSYHYLPPAEFSEADPGLVETVAGALVHLGVPVERGATWTTDAPFRETRDTIEAMTVRGLLAVEMEAAALYAFAAARGRAVLCFAHVTNQMALIEGDFEKGEADGTVGALTVIRAAAEAWRRASRRAR